jgi:hypothetical protein
VPLLAHCSHAGQAVAGQAEQDFVENVIWQSTPYYYCFFIIHDVHTKKGHSKLLLLLHPFEHKQ